MFRLGKKHPVLFEILLVVVAFLAAALITVGTSSFFTTADIGTSVARIAVGALLLPVFHKAFRVRNPFTRFGIVIPAFLFACWNLFYNFSSGMKLGSLSRFIEGAVTALAPALFEEVIFRGIFLYNLRENGHGDLSCLLISSFLFSAIHLTNIVGMDLVSVGIQMGYSFVIGLVFGAVYLHNGSLLQIIRAHFLTDFTNRIFVESASSASYAQLAVFCVLLAAEAVYAFMLMGKRSDNIPA